MYKLTERRFRIAKLILDKYREDLHANRRIDAMCFEVELRARWKVGYQEMKSIMADLLKRDYYRFLAAYYMEHINAPVIVSEFKTILAKCYGAKDFYGPDYGKRRDAFWRKMRVKSGKRPIR